MRRYLLVFALGIAAMVVALSTIRPTGRSHSARSATSGSLSPLRLLTTTATAHRPGRTARRLETARPAPTTATHEAPPKTTTPHTTPVITAPRTGCRWRRYPDGAIDSDPECAPGQLDPAVVGRAAQTVCNRRWVARASARQPPPGTLDRLLIEYQLPGNPATYTVGRVIPVEDGGSPTSPRNLYPLPLNGYGGQNTQTLVADGLHFEICAHRITVSQAVKTLTGDWLAGGLPDDG